MMVTNVQKDPHSDANHLFYHTQCKTYVQIFEKCQQGDKAEPPTPDEFQDYIK